MAFPLHFLFFCYLSVGIYGFVLVMVQPCIIVSPQSVLTPTPDNEPAWRVRARVAYNVKGLGAHLVCAFFLEHWESSLEEQGLEAAHAAGYIIEL